MSYLHGNSQQMFDSYLGLCTTVPSADIDRIHDIATTTIKYLQASKHKRQFLRLNQELEHRWYAALERGAIDWTVYRDPDYLAELWACWSVYSRQALKAVAHPRSLETKSVLDDIGPVQRVVDMGCGIGYSTASLRELYPDADVIGFDLSDSPQFGIASLVAGREGFRMVSSIDEVPQPVDLLLASEYFEHIPAPIEHLIEVINTLQPRAMLTANAFTAIAIGHFPSYLVDGKRVPGRDTSRAFAKAMREHGYTKVKTKLWNNRPAYWRRA